MMTPCLQCGSRNEALFVKKNTSDEGHHVFFSGTIHFFSAYANKIGIQKNFVITLN